MLIAGFPELLRLVVLAVPCSACIQLRRLTLSEAVVSAVRPLCRISKVAGVTRCVRLCTQEASCAAARYRSATNACDLLTARFDFLEGEAALANISGLVEVWAIVGRGFGECSASYTASWRSSRYRLSAVRNRWADAEVACRQQGFKLAELTSREEITALVRQLRLARLLFVLVGGRQLSGAEEPSGGWRWVRSGLPITRDTWTASGMDNYQGKEHFTVAWMTSNNIRFGDVSSTFKSVFMCECHALP